MCKYPKGVIVDIIKEEKDKHARFVLEGNTLYTSNTSKTLLCIGLNPSKANKEISDFTINKIINVAGNNSNQYTNWIMANLYPVYETDSKELSKISFDTSLSEINIKYIQNIILEDTIADVWILWGNTLHNSLSLLSYAIQIITNLSRKKNLRWHMRSITKEGHPEHLRGCSDNIELKPIDIQKYLSFLEWKKYCLENNELNEIS